MRQAIEGCNRGIIAGEPNDRSGSFITAVLSPSVLVLLKGLLLVMV